MGPVQTVVVFTLVWWLVFFMVLPIGVRRPHDPEPGTDPGAPARPMLWRKALATTLVATVLTGALHWLFAAGFSLRGALGS